MAKIKFTALGLILFFLAACEENNITSGIETLVYGKIYDSTNQIPIENIEIKIGEYKTGSSLAGRTFEFNRYIASTTTNSAGEYNLPFTTTGNGDLYEVKVEFKEDIHAPKLTDFIDDENIGGEQELNYESLKLFPVDLKISVTNLDNQEIFILNQFPGRNIPLNEPFISNTTRRLLIDKNVQNEINFRIRSTNPFLNSYLTLPLNNTTELYEYEIELDIADFE